MKIQLENNTVETKETIINGYKELWFRMNNSNVWYKSPYSSSYDLLRELAKLDDKGINTLIELIE